MDRVTRSRRSIALCNAGVSAAVTVVALCGGCPSPASQPLAPSTVWRHEHPGLGGPLWVHYPEIDLRIERIDEASGRRSTTLYPDLWLADTRAVLDFAVDRRSLFALLAARQRGDRRRLWAIDPQPDGERAQAIALQPAAERLAWARPPGQPARLLVGHGTSTRGPAGRLTVVDPKRRRVLRSIALQGACLAITTAGEHVFVIERQARLVTRARAKRGRADHVAAETPQWRTTHQPTVTIFSLARLSLDHGRVERRVALPAGARRMGLGPNGLLYVSHTSGSGQHATDGSLSVVDPASLRVVGRLRLGMTVRALSPTPRHLAVNLLSASGQAWIAAIDARGAVAFDGLLPRPVGASMTAIGEEAYIAQRQRGALEHVDLATGTIDAPLLLEARHAGDDRAGLVRGTLTER